VYLERANNCFVSLVLSDVCLALKTIEPVATNLLKLISAYYAWPVAKKLLVKITMRRTEDQPLVSVLGTRENYDGYVTSPEANGSVSCLPTGVLSEAIAPSKSRTWKKSGTH